MAILNAYRHYAAGQLYSFTYSPRWLNRLSIYDKYPLLMFFNYNNVYGLLSGINFHFLTVSQRAKLIEVITKAYDIKDLSEWGKPIPITWDNVRYLGLPYMLAWRRYFPNRVRNLKAIAPKWDFEEIKKYVIDANTQKIIGVTSEYIQKFYMDSMSRKLRNVAQKHREANKMVEQAQQSAQNINKTPNAHIVW